MKWLYLIAGVAFLIGLTVGAAGVYLYPDVAHNKAIRSLQEENDLLREMNALLESRAREIERALNRPSPD